MKKISIKVNKALKTANIFLNAINDFDQEKQVASLNKIAKLFIRKRIYAEYVEDDKHKIEIDHKKVDFVIYKAQKWCSILFIRTKNEYLSDMITMAVQNSETTEIYFIDEFGWDDFLKRKGVMKSSEYKATLVINDNCETYIKFSIETYNFDEIVEQIKLILS